MRIWIIALAFVSFIVGQGLAERANADQGGMTYQQAERIARALERIANECR